ncbi:MAG: response regulator [Thermodesulfobacteriota bacterium]
MEHAILFVDDEKNILRTLQRLFMDEPYRILLANSGPEGLALLEQGERPAVIVSDQRMPGMGGVEFLTKAQALAPDSIRMVLTGYADINAAVDAVNLGGASRYLLKPWHDDDLRLVIRDAVARFDLERANRELTFQLTDQNRQLEELTAELEERVQLRTRELDDALQTQRRLSRMLERKVQELEGRDRIQQHLLTLHPLAETLKTVLETVVRAVPVDRAALYLTPLAGEEQGPAASHPDAGDGDLLAGLADEVRQVAASGEPWTGVVGPDTAVLLVPMVKGDEVLGVMAVSRGGPQPLRDEERKALASLVGLAAIAVHDSRVHDGLPSLCATLDEVLGGL